MQNKTTISFLNSQYKKILKKCFLISISAFTLLCPQIATAASTPTLGSDATYIVEEVQSSKSYYTTFDVIENGTTKQYGILLKGKNGTDTINNLDDLIINYVTGTTSQGYNIATATSGTTGTGYFDVKYTDPAGVNKVLTFFMTDASNNPVTNTNNRINNSSSSYGNINQDFIANKLSGASANGGAIYNIGTISNIVGNFIANSANGTAGSSEGGAIWNNTGAKIGNITGNFIGNSSTATGGGLGGGAITNAGIIGDITGDFIGNYKTASTASSAGAIRNENPNTKIGNITGNFIGNYVYVTTGLSYAGAIRNISGASIESITGDFIGNYVIAAKQNASAGAIRSSDSNIGFIKGDFINNYALSVTTFSEGGAVHNSGISIKSIEGNFINNYAAAKTYAHGGALYNTNTIALAGDFIGNYATSTSGTALAGAIYNSGTINISDSSFQNNYVQSGTNPITYQAIYNLGKINLSGDITTYDTFSGTGNYNLTSGTLTFLGANAGFSDTSKLNTSAGTKINTIDSIIDTTNLGVLKLSGDINYGIDVNLTDKTGDELSGTLASTSTGNIIIDEINVIGANRDKDVEIDLTNDFSNIIRLSTNETITEGYDAISYEWNTGILTLKKDYTLNEAVVDTDDDRSYTMATEELVTADLGVMAGSILTVNAETNDITASNVAGMTMTTGQTVTFNDLGTVSGFDGYFISATGGIININNATSIENAITSTSDINISGNTTFNNTTITGDITLNNDTTFNNTTVSGTIGGVGSILTSGTTTFDDAIINGTVAGTGNITISGTTNLNSTLNTNNVITNNGILNINSNLTLNNTLAGGTVNLNNAILTLNNAGMSTGTTFNAKNATLNTIDNAIGIHELGTSDFDNAKLAIDVKLNLPTGIATSDTFTGIASGEIQLETINVLDIDPTENVHGASGSIDLFTNPNSDVTIFGKSFTIFSKPYTLTFTTDAMDNSKLNYNLAAENNNLVTAITSIITPRQYIMTGNEGAGTSSLVGTMTIVGNNNTITDGTIDMDAGAELSLQSVNMGANIDGNGAKLNISGIGNFTYSGTMDNLVTTVNSNITRTNQDTNMDYTIGSGTLAYKQDSYLGGGTNSLTFTGGNLNIANAQTTNINLDSLTLTNDTSWSIDVDLAAESMDKLTVTNVNGLASLNINNLNLLSDAEDLTTRINFTEHTTLMGQVSYTGDNPIAYSPLYKYTVSYEQTDGFFTFERASTGGSTDFNPSAYTGTVGRDTNYYMITDIFEQVLVNPNTIDTHHLLAKGQPSGDEVKYANVWTKFYGTDEDIKLDSFTVETKNFGAILGVDTKRYELEDNATALYSGYIAYVGSTQEYEAVDVNQNGMVIGGRALFTHNNLYLGTTANIGANFGQGTNMYGNENFNMYSLGISNKIGYTASYQDEKYVIEPSMMFSYIFNYTPGYKNSANHKVENSKLNALQIRPEVKFIANLDNGYTPYFAIAYNWNVVDASKITINETSVPHLAIDPYAEFKIGTWKKHNNNLSYYGEISATQGGREGFGAQLGLKWEF